MKRTRICHLLKITYPLLQGGMLWLATARLAAAVSNAGGLGVISPLAQMPDDGDPAQNLKKQICKIRTLTEKPFGVNIPLDLEYAGTLINVLLEENVGIGITAAGNPEHYTQLLKTRNVTVLHVVSSVAQAVHASSAGVDAVIVEGVEAAAHLGIDELPLFSLVPQVVDSVSIPVIAAGGIADARGIVAAFSLGAQGVQMGTRFLAVEECCAHANYKQAILDAKDTDTVITCRRLIPTRSLKTPFTNRLIEMEKEGATTEAIVAYLGYRRNRIAQVEGYLEKGEAYCGASAGLIRDILPVEQLILQWVSGYHEIVQKLKDE